MLETCIYRFFICGFHIQGFNQPQTENIWKIKKKKIPESSKN